MTAAHHPDAPEVTLADAIPASAGSSAAVPVRVRHRGRRPARIRVTIFGLDSRWVPQPLDLGVLQPGDTAAIKLSIVPERGALGARYPFTIAAEAAPADGRGRPVVGVAESVLALDAAERISMAISPSTPEGSFSKGFSVEITNPGDRERTFTLVPTSAAGVTARLAADSVTVPPASTATVRGRVRVNSPTFFGGQNTHTFTVSAQGTGAPEWAEATMRSKPIIGRGLRAAVGLVLVVALWATLAIVFIPKISNAFKPKNETAASSVQTGEGGGDGAAGSGSGSGDGTGSGAGNGSGSGDGADGSGSGSNGGASGAGGGHPAGGYQLSGTVTGPGADGAAVTLTPVSLASAGDDGSLPAAQSVGTSPNALRGQGAAFAPAAAAAPAAAVSPAAVPAAAAHPTAAPAADPIGKIPGPLAGVAPGGFQTTTVLTKEKGEFTFAGVTAPGFYLLSIANAGYQTQRFLINSASLASPQPLKVELQPGKGKLSGMVTGPNGSPLGAATIVVTDGTVTLQTSSVSASTRSGTPGSWTLDQVSTPGTYLVTATSPGLGAASTLVSLDASGSATVNLSLQSGQTSITGTVSGADSLGVTGGLGGITVSATDGDTTRTATTVTSAALRGTYVLPNLPTPGSYTLTISGSGFRTQTREVSLPAGSGNLVIDATLSRADSNVSGQVTGLDANGKAEGGLAGVGLTLASNDVTLKTMSTSGATAGSFQFTGVAPGSYVLTAVQFGRTAASATVEVQAAATETVNLVLKADIGAELPATAHIRGQVADSRTGGPLTCDRALQTVAASDCVATVTVTAPKDAADESKGTVTYTSKATAALNYVYTIPDVDDPDHAGLPPGLYTVKISAPGYEDTVTHVQVAEGQTMPAPPASMPALGIISGTVTTRVDKPDKPSCVLAVPVGVTVPKTLPTSCTPSADKNTCTAAGITGAQPCALTSQGGTDEAPLGTFQVRGLTHGRYQMVLISQDPEYVYTVGAVPIVTLELGADGQFNAVLDRLGRITVNVVKVDAQTGSVNGVTGAVVTATKVSGDGVATASPATTDATGIAILKGLNGKYKVETTFSESGQTITVDATSDPTGLNQTVPVTLFLAKKSGVLVGRVITDGGETQPSPVAGVTLTVNGVVGYQGATASTGSVQVTTKANGCYAIVPEDWSAAGNPTLTSPDCPAGTFSVTDSPVVGAVGAVGVLKNLLTGQPATLINDRVDVSVAALPKSPSGTWTEPYPVTGKGITDCASGCAPAVGTRAAREIPPINVKASAMSAAGLYLYVAGPTGFTPPGATGAHVTVLAKPSASGGVTLAASALASWSNFGGAPGGGDLKGIPLVFTDSQYGGTPGVALPGRYKLQVSLAGFVTQDVDLVCRFQGTCYFAAPNGTTPSQLRLNRLPSISVTIGPLTGPDVDWTQAAVSQTSGAALGAVTVFHSADPKASKLQFSGSDTKVVTAGTSYSFSLSVPGYGTSTVSVSCGDDYLSTSPPCSATATLASLPYFPSGAGAGAAIVLTPAVEPVSGGNISTTAITTTIAPNPGASILVSVDANGDVTWKDSRAGILPGQVVPGDYTLTFHRSGFIDTAAYLSCDSTSCTLYSDAGHSTALTAAISMPMLPQPAITVKATLATPHTAGAFTFGSSSFTVYRVVGATQTKMTSASLGLGAGTVADDGGGTGSTVTADVSWWDTAQAFAGIASQQQYKIVATIDGFQQGDVTIDCTSGGACTGEIALASNPAASGSLTVTKLPATTAPVVFNVAGPAGAPTVSLTESVAGDGTLTWQQGSAQPNVITPGTYQITATLSGYESAEVTGGVAAAKNVISFTCASGACTFPQIVMTKAATLALVVKGDDGSTAGEIAMTLKRPASADTPLAATTGTASVSGRSTTNVQKVTISGTDYWLDGSYSLDVKAAGYAFATGLDKSATSSVSCTFSEGGVPHTVGGLYLAPGGTTTCTVTLQKLGTIVGATSWKSVSLDGATTVSTEAIGGIALKATLLDASGQPTSTSFTATSATTAAGSVAVGDFRLTGTTATGGEGLTPGNWKVETTAAAPKFAAFTGVVTINASHTLVQTDSSEAATAGLTALAVSGGEIAVVLAPVTGKLNVAFKAGGTQIAVPNVTVLLKDRRVTGGPVSWTCAVASSVATPTPASVCSLTGSGSTQHVQFSALSPGMYDITMTFSGGQYNTVQYEAKVEPTGGDQTLTFTLDAQAGTISGALVDSTNTAISSFPAGVATVQLFKWNCTPLGDTTCEVKKFDNTAAKTTTNTSTFTLDDLPSGDYQIRVTAPGYADKWSNYIKVVVGSPTPPPTLQLLPAKANVTIALHDGAGVALTAGTATLVPVSSPHSPANPASPPVSGTIGAGGKVTFNQLLTGEYSVTVSGQPGAPYPSTTTSTFDVSSALDGTPQDLSASPLTLNQVSVPLTVNFTAGGCSALPTGSVAVEITNGISPAVWVSIAAATISGTAATTSVMLPPGTYPWRVTAPTGWTAPTDPSFTVSGPTATAPSTGDTVSLTSSASPNFTATWKVDGTAVSGATITATASGQTDVVAVTDGNGKAPMCLAGDSSGIAWTVTPTASGGTPTIAGFTGVTVTVTDTTASPTNSTIEGYTLKPAAKLASGAPGGASVTADISISGSVFSASAVTVAKGSGWTGTPVIVPAGTYTLTATPNPAVAGYGTGTVSGVTVGSGTNAPTDVSATIPYTAPAPTYSVTPTVTLASGSPAPADTVTFTVTIGSHSATGKFTSGTWAWTSTPPFTLEAGTNVAVSVSVPTGGATILPTSVDITSDAATHTPALEITYTP